MPQNAAANNFATTLSAALFGSTTLSAALTEGTAYTSLAVAATNGPIAAGDTLTLSEASAITLAAGANLSTTLAAALTGGNYYYTLTIPALTAPLPQLTSITLQDTVSSALTVALTEGTAVTSLSCNATNGYMIQYCQILLQDSLGATLATALASGTGYSSITVGPASVAGTLASGAYLLLTSSGNTQVLQTSAAATLSTTANTTISVVAFTANYSYPAATTISVQQYFSTSAAVAAASTSIAVNSTTPVWSFNTSTVIYTTARFSMLNALDVGGTSPGIWADFPGWHASYAFSTSTTVICTPPTTATVAGQMYEYLVVGALSGSLGNGAMLILPNGETTYTTSALSSGAQVIPVTPFKALAAYANGTGAAVGQIVTADATAAGSTTISLSASTTAFWSYSTSSTVEAATSAISLTSLTGAPSSYPWLAALTKAGDTYPNPSDPFEVVQMVAPGICARGAEGTVQAWATGDNVLNSLTADQHNDTTDRLWPADWAKIILTSWYGYTHNMNGASGVESGVGVVDDSWAFCQAGVSNSGFGYIYMGPGGSGTISGALMSWRIAGACGGLIFSSLPAAPGDYAEIDLFNSPGSPINNMQPGSFGLRVYYNSGGLHTALVYNDGASDVIIESSVQITDLYHPHQFVVAAISTPTKCTLVLYIDDILAASAGVPASFYGYTATKGFYPTAAAYNGPSSTSNVYFEITVPRLMWGIA